MTVTVDVVSSFYPSEVAYSFEFQIRIIDCNVEENYFEFTKDPIIVCRRNKPPGALNQKQEVSVMATERKTVDVGFPFDEEGDPIFLKEWGFLDLSPGEKDPTWIQLKSDSIENGVFFEITPSVND